jgi:hypothetical protein
MGLFQARSCGFCGGGALRQKLVSELELTKILTERMRQQADVVGHEITRVFRLTLLDTNGCNWMPDYGSVTSLGVLLKVLDDVRAGFNLKDPESTDSDT